MDKVFRNVYEVKNGSVVFEIFPLGENFIYVYNAEGELKANMEICVEFDRKKLADEVVVYVDSRFSKFVKHNSVHEWVMNKIYPLLDLPGGKHNLPWRWATAWDVKG